MIEMIWEVEIRPMSNLESFVQFFTSGIIATLARNFKCHLEEPGAMVSVKRSILEQTISLSQPWT